LECRNEKFDFIVSDVITVQRFHRVECMNDT
jgi:hypothetical protein